MVTHYACNIQIFLGFYLGLGFESVFSLIENVQLTQPLL